MKKKKPFTRQSTLYVLLEVYFLRIRLSNNFHFISNLLQAQAELEDIPLIPSIGNQL